MLFENSGVVLKILEIFLSCKCSTLLMLPILFISVCYVILYLTILIACFLHIFRCVTGRLTSLTYIWNQVFKNRCYRWNIIPHIVHFVWLNESMSEPKLSKKRMRHAVIVALAEDAFNLEVVTFLNLIRSFVFNTRRELKPGGKCFMYTVKKCNPTEVKFSIRCAN